MWGVWESLCRVLPGQRSLLCLGWHRVLKILSYCQEVWGVDKQMLLFNLYLFSEGLPRLHGSFQQHRPIVFMASHVVTPGSYQCTWIQLLRLALKHSAINALLKGLTVHNLDSLTSVSNSPRIQICTQMPGITLKDGSNLKLQCYTKHKIQ